MPRPPTDPNSQGLTLRTQNSLTKACPHGPGQTRSAMPRWQMEGREREGEHLAWFKQCHCSAAIPYLFYLLSTRTGSVVTSGNIEHFMSDSHPISTATSVCYTTLFSFSVGISRSAICRPQLLPNAPAENLTRHKDRPFLLSIYFKCTLITFNVLNGRRLCGVGEADWGHFRECLWIHLTREQYWHFWDEILHVSTLPLMWSILNKELHV